MSNTTWRKVPGAGGRGMRIHGHELLWITMTAKEHRRSIGVDKAGLKFTSSGPAVVECQYDSSRQAINGIHPLLLQVHSAGETHLTAHHQGTAVGTLRVTVCPGRKVTLVTRNAVSDVDPAEQGTRAKDATALAPRLKSVFDSQGGFHFAITQRKDVHLNADQLIRPGGVYGQRSLVQVSDDSVETVLKQTLNVVDAAADFTLLFCKALYGSPCALGISLGRLILIDESVFGDTFDPEFLAKVVAHELVHSMGHTKERFRVNHYEKKPDNLMYPQATGSIRLTPEQVEQISHHKNWYRA